MSPIMWSFEVKHWTTPQWFFHLSHDFSIQCYINQPRLKKKIFKSSSIQQPNHIQASKDFDVILQYWLLHQIIKPWNAPLPPLYKMSMIQNDSIVSIKVHNQQKKVGKIR
jgi:hypothetical protein